MYQNSLFAGRRVMDKPRFLELQPFFVGEIVEFVFWHGVFGGRVAPCLSGRIETTGFKIAFVI